MKQRNISLLFIAILLLLFQTGCITFTTMIKLKLDGSGQIVQTMMMNTKAMESMLGEMKVDKEEKMDKDEKTGDLEQAKEAAKEMGEGVTFVSMDEIDTQEGKGFRAVYAFEDISKVRISQTPTGDTAPAAGGLGKDEDTWVRFRFEKKRRKATLTAVFPREEEAEVPEEEAPEEPVPEAAGEMGDAMLEMMKGMLEGLRFGIFVEVDGRLIRTNSTHVEGNTVTLMDIDFGKLLTNEGVMKKLAAHQGASFKQTQELLKDVEGITLPPGSEVSIVFR